MDAFANRLAYYHTRPGNGQSPNLFADSATSYGAIGQVLDSLDEIDVLRQDETNELAQVLDDSALHKWLDIYDGISSLDMSQKRIPHPDGEGSVLKEYFLTIINIKLKLGEKSTGAVGKVNFKRSKFWRFFVFLELTTSLTRSKQV